MVIAARYILMKIKLIQIMIGFSLHIGKLVYKFLNEMLKDINVIGSFFLSQTYFLSLSFEKVLS